MLTIAAQNPAPRGGGTLIGAALLTLPFSSCLHSTFITLFLSILPTTYLITGASRGIGLAVAAQLLAASPANRVVAAVRKPAEAAHLHVLKTKFGERLELLEMDVVSIVVMLGEYIDARC